MGNEQTLGRDLWRLAAEAERRGVRILDEELGGYVYNLSTQGLSAGTWQLSFTVDGVEERVVSLEGIQRLWSRACPRP